MAVDSTKSIAENYSKYSQYFTKDKTDLANTETFYKLLLAEMTNQDPMEPTSNTEFVSQLATFSSLQNQSNALAYQQSTYATSLAGKNVTIASDTGSGLAVETGVVTAVDLSDSKNIEVTVNGKRYALKYVMSVNDEDPSTVKNANGSDGAYATSLIGKQITVKENNVVDQGVAEQIEVKDGKYYVVVNGMSYELTSVVRVTEPEEPEEIPPETSLLEEEQNNYGYQNIAYAVSLTGKNVTVRVASDDGVFVTTGLVTAVDLVDAKDIGIIMNDARYSLSDVIMVNDSGNGGDGAYATSLIGKQVTVEEDGAVASGTVEYIEARNGAYTVVINGTSYKLSSVVRVANPEGAASAEDDGADAVIVTDPDAEVPDVPDITDNGDNTGAADGTDSTVTDSTDTSGGAADQPAQSDGTA